MNKCCICKKRPCVFPKDSLEKIVCSSKCMFELVSKDDNMSEYLECCIEHGSWFYNVDGKGGCAICREEGRDK